MSPPSKRMKATKQATSIDDLPPEMISELFEHLQPRDLVACSMVNKRWHSIYGAFKLQSLIVKDYDEDEFFRWYDSNQTVEKTCICPPVMFCRLLEKPLLSNLKHLAVYVWRPKFDLNKLNRFQQLVHLEIRVGSIDEEVHLNLSRLKVLALHEWNHRCALSIDCPLLSTLVYAGEPNDATLLKVKHPETIRKLVTDMAGQKMILFRSVECLVVHRFRTINENILLSLPKLRELHYKNDIESVFEFTFEARTVDQMKQTLSEFLKEAKKRRGNSFRFTFAGFLLTNVKLDQIDFGVRVDEETGRESVSNEYVYMKNYHLVEPGALPFVDRVNYNDLLSHVTGEFPRCFFQKFTGIEWVEAPAKVRDPEHFLWFLKSVRSLRLSLGQTELSQEFYDQLPESIPLLSNLYLFNEHCEAGLQLNFDFIDRLSRLSWLEIDPNIPLESAISLTKLLGRLEVCFHVQSSKKERFEIEKRRDSTKWRILMDEADRYGTVRRNQCVVKVKRRALDFETENLEEVVEFFERLQENLPWRTFYRKKHEIYTREKKKKEKSAKSD